MHRRCHGLTVTNPATVMSCNLNPGCDTPSAWCHAKTGNSARHDTCKWTFKQGNDCDATGPVFQDYYSCMQRRVLQSRFMTSGAHFLYKGNKQRMQASVFLSRQTTVKQKVLKLLEQMKRWYVTDKTIHSSSSFILLQIWKTVLFVVDWFCKRKRNGDRQILSTRSSWQLPPTYRAVPLCPPSTVISNQLL